MLVFLQYCWSCSPAICDDPCRGNLLRRCYVVRALSNIHSTSARSHSETLRLILLVSQAPAGNATSVVSNPSTQVCSADKCSFNVSSAGVLSRTGGDACGSCGFLYLSYRFITSIAPGTFQGMVHVTTLDLSNNQLGSITYDDFKNLTALRTLILNNNRIASVAPGTFAGMAAVESINLENNRISSPIAPGTFAGLSAVRSLSLSYNLITSIGAESFAGLIGVTMLSLSSSSYCYSGQACGRVQSIEDGAFRHMPNLHTLNLQYHDLSIIRTGTFGGGLAKLKILDLSTYDSSYYCGNPPFGYFSGLRIASGAFAGLGGLESLNLQGCQIPDNVFGQSLFRHNRNLTRLDLGNNRLTSLTEDTFKGLNGTLQSLYLSYNQISSIAERTFLGFSRLYHLQLDYNELTMLPVNVFANMTMVDSNGNYNGGQSVYVYLYGNPLVCRPSEPRNGYLYVSDLYSSSSSSNHYLIPRCPAKVSRPHAFWPHFGRRVPLS
jgi:Leucine-rich repeat (LRR) protein